MKRGKFTVLQNKELAPATFRMVLAGDTEAIIRAGTVCEHRADREVSPPPHFRL